jgi:hypothetical protein
MTKCFGLYFLRSSSGRKYPLLRRLYNVYSVVSGIYKLSQYKLFLRSYNLYNLLYILYSNEIFSYISFIDKTRSRLQK